MGSFLLAFLDRMIMKRVFDNARILYGDDLEEVKGYIIVKDRIIEEVGEGSYIGGKEDVKGGVVSPCFTNTHMHIGDSAGMDLGATLKLGERVGKCGLKYEIHRRADASSAIAWTLDTMLKGGTTAFCDFREGGVEGIDLLKKHLNMQARILGRPAEGEGFMERCDGFGISKLKDYPPHVIEDVLKRRKGKLIAAHAGEASDDVPHVLDIDPDFLVHLTNASKKSLGTVFKKRVPIVLCPRANASFGVGIPDLKSILEGPCLVGLGTDNVMANSTNMFREMEFLYKLYRGLYRDHSFNARVVLRAATTAGRKILKMPDNTIKEGNVADFMVTRSLKFENDPAMALVHRLDASDIREVISPSF